MIIVTFLLGDGRPPFRQLWEGELPQVPNEGEPIAFNERIYRVLERSWRIGLATEEEQTALGPMNGPKKVRMGCGLLLTQIAGPAHVTLASAG